MGVGSLCVASAAPAVETGKSDTVLRPPGAGPDFLSRCVRCGKCVEACPYDSIRLSGISAGKGIFTPYIDPFKTPCYLCRESGPDGDSKPVGPLLRCGEACPSGALEIISNDPETLSHLPVSIKTGVARIDRDICLAWQFGFCCECYLHCPLKDKALLPKPAGEQTVGTGLFPDVNPDACTGCGRCVYVCPVRPGSAAENDRKGKIPGYLERKYGAMVRKILERSGETAEYPAIRVRKESC